MSSLLRSRRRAEEFAELVDGPPGDAPDDSPLLVLVGALRAYDDHRAVPREGFAADLRQRLLAEAVLVSPAPARLVLPPRTHGLRERRLVAGAAVVVLLGGTAGVGAAAEQALPGQALYPVKRGVEAMQVHLSGSSRGQGRHLLDQATDRLDEVGGLVASGPGTSSAQIPATLTEFTRQSRQGATLLMASYRKTENPATISELRTSTADDLGTLESLAVMAPASAQPALAEAARALTEIDAEASELCASCSDLPPLQVPDVLSAATEADRALSAAADLPLDNSHPVDLNAQDLGPVMTDPSAPSVPSVASGPSAADTPSAADSPSAASDPGDSDPNSAPEVTSAPSALAPVLPTEQPTVPDPLPESSDAPDPGDVVETLIPDAGDAAGSVLGQ